MTDIIGIHGIFQYKYHSDPEILTNLWRASLERSGIDAELDLAYFAPTLHRASAMGDEIVELNREEAALAAQWLLAAGAPGAVAQGRLTAWVRDSLDWLILSGMARGATKAMTQSIIREVATYLDLSNTEPRENAKEIVAEAIRTHQPRIVIAHSLGSVVAYEALWAAAGLTVPCLLTIGSPLALPGAFRGSFLPEAANANTKPPGVTRWINVTDVGDVVAVPKGLSTFFAGVDEELEISINPFECHRVSYYLESPEVAAILDRELARS
ncbi:hypothetical protein [Microbacterium sp. BR1]|uniref:hypothetical protein n=1 Tax=Microbacterium sp. BR1 TaxID=1070896 RepID=UPI000C2CCFBE|nr:hypothetical protein [Microbacterium sp. BR1]